MRLSSLIVLIITLFILIRCSQAVNDTTDEQTCRFNLNTILGATANGTNTTTGCTEVRALVTLPTYMYIPTNQHLPPTPSSLILSFLPHAVLGDLYWAGVLQAGSHQLCCDSTQHIRGGNIAAVSSFTIPLSLFTHLSPGPSLYTPLSPLFTHLSLLSLHTSLPSLYTPLSPLFTHLSPLTHTPPLSPHAHTLSPLSRTQHFLQVW